MSPSNIASGPAAAPFHISGPGYDAAVDCLANAVYYEAAIDGDAGERAVAQVIINRTRHPAFPASVCGVVFQGAERSTGCQFTFTCDGALARLPSGAGWARARKIATAAVTGHVFAPVGLATHYHANTVIPYWAASLEKSNTVGTQLFYRWPGVWGTPAAFKQRYAQNEPDESVFMKRWRPAEPSDLAKVDVPSVLPAEKTAVGILKEGGALKVDGIPSRLQPSLDVDRKPEADRTKSVLIADEPGHRGRLILDEK